MTGHGAHSAKRVGGWKRIGLVTMMVAAWFVVVPPAEALPVVLIVESGGSTDVAEGGGTDTYTVALQDPPTTNVVVVLETTDGQVSVDTPASQQLTFTTSDFGPQTVTVSAVNDSVVEGAHTGTVNHTIAPGSAVEYLSADPGSVTASITDNDSAVLSISDAAAVTEGGTANFTVTLSPASSQTVTVDYATANGSAVAPGDYTAIPSTQLTFIPGQTTKPVVVTTIDDGTDENQESFTVELSGASNATLGTASGTGTINDNDSPPSVSIADGSAVEGAGSMTFNVNLSAPSGFATSVNYATTPGSAVTPGDFTTSTGTVNFAPNDTSESITVPIVNDALDEPAETFTVTLSSPTLLTIADGTATGTINDDDPTPSLSVNSVQVEEGLPVVFTVSLSAASGRTVTVNRATANGTATSPADYGALPSAPLTFTPGQTTKTVNVTTVEDTAVEPNETFNLNLTGASNASIATGTGVGTILNDDGDPGLSVLDATPAPEGSAGLVFTIALLPAWDQTVRVNYATADGTAKATSDYTAVTGFVEFPPGQTTRTVTVPITNDTTDEITETLLLNLSSPVSAAIADAQGTGSILDNDNKDPVVEVFETLDISNNAMFQFGTGDTVKIRVNFTDPGLADAHSVTVNWGDGSAPLAFPVAAAGPRSFERTHTFTTEGFYQISVSIADGDGGSVADERFVTVSGPSIGDGDDTVGLVDPTRGIWRLYNDMGVAVTEFYYGNPGDYPFMGDWDGDGISTPGLYRQSDGYVYLRNSNTQGIADIKFFFGNPGDVPIAGDFNGDGFDTVSIYRPSNQTFYIINKLGSGDQGLGAAEISYVFGNPGDKPFVGDFDGDGIETAGLHRESTGLVYFRNSHTQGIADNQFIYGDPNDQLVAGDWTVDGIDSPAIYRSSDQTFYFRFTNTQGNADATFDAGVSGWIPVAGVTGASG